MFKKVYTRHVAVRGEEVEAPLATSYDERRLTRRRAWRSALVLAAFVTSVVPQLVTVDGDASPVPSRGTHRNPARSSLLFGEAGPWNAPLPATPVLDHDSEEIVEYLSTARHPAVTNLYEFGVPIWDADASTPRYDVKCLEPWGTCGLEEQPVPLPDEAFATDVTDDGAMVVIDSSTRTSYEFYDGQKLDGTWQAGWGDAVDIDGDGTGGATGAGISRLAGVIRASEIAARVIDHALVFSTNNACAKVYRYPATKTDGTSTRSDCIPEGARIQLDPDIDLDKITDFTPAEKAVARALQTYGAYAIDNGGANMAFIFEVPSGEEDPYQNAGLAWDYYGMDRVPWRSLRVLSQWNGHG